MTYRPDNVSTVDLIHAWIEQHGLETHTAFPGRLQNYNPTTQTADIVPLIQHPVPQADGSTVMENLPVLPHVRVMFPRSAGFFISFPLQDGDTVLVVVCDGDFSGFVTSREAIPGVTPPRDLSRHSLSYAVAFPGFVPHAKALTHVPPVGETAGLVVGDDANGGARITIKPGGVVEITVGATVVARIDADGTVHVGGSAGEFIALANLVDSRLSAIRTAFNTHIHAETGGSTAAPTTPMSAIASVAATKAKAT